MRIAGIIKNVQRHLTPDLLQGRWKEQTHPLQGYCYVAAEVMWHILGKVDWKPMCATYNDTKGRATHWWLVNKYTGKIVDPTKEQFLPNNPPYSIGRGAMFLTQEPSKRAKLVIDKLNTKKS
jgi:hypothetical protein